MSNFSFSPPSTIGYPSNFGITLNIQLPNAALPPVVTAPPARPEVEVHPLSGTTYDLTSNVRHNNHQHQRPNEHNSFTTPTPASTLHHGVLDQLGNQASNTIFQNAELRKDLEATTATVNGISLELDDEKNRNEALRNENRDLEARLEVEKQEHQLVNERLTSLETQYKEIFKLISKASDKPVRINEEQICKLKNDIIQDVEEDLKVSVQSMVEDGFMSKKEKNQAVKKAGEKVLNEMMQIKDEVMKEKSKINQIIKQHSADIKTNSDTSKAMVEKSKSIQEDIKVNVDEAFQEIAKSVEANIKSIQAYDAKNLAKIDSAIEAGLKIIKEAEETSVAAVNKNPKLIATCSPIFILHSANTDDFTPEKTAAAINLCKKIDPTNKLKHTGGSHNESFLFRIVRRDEHSPVSSFVLPQDNQENYKSSAQKVDENERMSFDSYLKKREGKSASRTGR